MSNPVAIDAQRAPSNPASPGAPEISRQKSQPAERPELLAPAGDWDCARAAVENGADAIYFGLERFNARMRAHNFTEADLPGLLEFLHQRGVKGYVTLNTLVFQNELSEAKQCLQAMIAAGVDAVIVQDVGICRLVRRLSPDFPIHASTQMTITSAAGVAFARNLGCNLVVLARECSLKEIERIQRSPAPEESSSEISGGLPLEVFIHGALCVAYSGQCLTSEALGGRSANRGECAQACRMPYELIADGQKVDLGDRRYLLSPQDLAGLEMLPELVRAGIASLKIEGRLKSPEYVASITRVYRDALDLLPAADVLPEHHAAERSGADRPQPAPIPAATRYDLEMAFSRGLYTGWFEGINNQKLVHARFGKKRGVFLGCVRVICEDAVLIDLAAPLKPGDGVVFDSGTPDVPEEGGRVYQVVQQAGGTKLGFGRKDVDFARVRVGDRVWKTSDPELDRRVRQSFAGTGPRFHRPVSLEVHGRVGTKMHVIVRDELGHVVQVESAMPLAAADSQPLTTDRLREQFGRLGGTALCLGLLQNSLEGDVILPISELNRLRREWVAELERRRKQPKRWTLRELRASGSDRLEVTSTDRAKPNSLGVPEISVLVRSLSQLDAALSSGLIRYYCDLDNPKQYREAVELFRRWQGQAEATRSAASLFVAPPRIFKPGEEWILNQVRSCAPDGYLVRNYDHLKAFAGCRCVGDYSLNVANAMTAEYYRDRYALERVTTSYDLNHGQLEALLAAAPPEWFEITIHQHMPMFHMEHCVFCAFLSSGTDYTNCGRPCDRHEVRLQDRVGAKHPVRADAGCRNTVFNSLAQTGAENLEALIKLGARFFRLEFLDEPADLVRKTIAQYQKLLAGQIKGSQLWRELKLLNQLGVTRGQVDKRGPHRGGQ